MPSGYESAYNHLLLPQGGELFSFFSDTRPKVLVVYGQPVSITVQDGYYAAICGKPDKPAEVSVQF